MYTAVQRIKELRDQGWKVKVRIDRVVGFEQTDDGPKPVFASRADGRSGADFLPRGGRTTVRIEPPEGEPIVGVALCHTEKDNFNKKVGLEAAFGRAMRKIGNGSADSS